MIKWLAGCLVVLCLGGWPAFAQQSPQVPVIGASVSQVTIKAAAGVLFDGYVTVSPGATGSGYLFVFNSASAVSNGSVVGGAAMGDYQDCIFIPNPGTFPFSTFGLPSEFFSAGITMAFSSTGCGTLTLSSATLIKGRAQ